VSDLFSNAGRIFETATAAATAQAPSELAILIGHDGAIHLVADSGRPLDSLASHHGARLSYRVLRNGDRVRVEGRSFNQSCLLESETSAAFARRLLADQPRYRLE